MYAKAVIAALVLCAMSGPAFAQASGFMIADANHDGAVVRTEYDAALADGFNRVDTNRDGQFSLAERRAIGGGPSGSAPDPDANRDGVVTRAEYDAFHGARFTRLDRNGDGRITPDELPPR